MGFEKVGELPLTSECHHYESQDEVPWDIQKYWNQRYSLFSYYDEGIYLTDDAWFGVTPEPVASKIAEDLGAMSAPTKTTLVDIFGGAGGNTIAFALSGRWERVISIERDAATLACAQYNASIYGVSESITWVLGDCFDYLVRAAADSAGFDAAAAGVDGELDPELRLNLATTTIFASPPWGGVNYRLHDVFDLSTMQPYNLEQLHEACWPLEHALYLPRTSDLRQIAKLAPAGGNVEVVQYCMEGASKAMVAYVPEELEAETPS